jgi:DNA-binding XRE family transcriptional regulator
MPGAAKMPHIEEMTITLEKPGRKARSFTVPVSVGRDLEKFIKGSAKADKAIPAESVLPELADDDLRPAAMLRGIRHREEMTQKELAKRINIRQHHLSEMENGKRPIGKAMAKKLADVFDCDYKLFL